MIPPLPDPAQDSVRDPHTPARPGDPWPVAARPSRLPQDAVPRPSGRRTPSPPVPLARAEAAKSAPEPQRGKAARGLLGCAVLAGLWVVIFVVVAFFGVGSGATDSAFTLWMWTTGAWFGLLFLLAKAAGH